MLVLICIGVGYRPLVRLPHDIYFMATAEPPEDPNFPAYKMPDYVTSWEPILNGILSSATLRLAVVVNLTRWFLLYLSLRLQEEEYDSKAADWYQRNRIATLIGMWTVIAFQIVATIIAQIDIHWLKLIEKIWNYYIVVISPIIGYSVIYCLVWRYYQRLMQKNKGVLSTEEVK